MCVFPKHDDWVWRARSKDANKTQTCWAYHTQLYVEVGWCSMRRMLRCEQWWKPCRTSSTNPHAKVRPLSCIGSKSIRKTLRTNPGFGQGNQKKQRRPLDEFLCNLSLRGSGVELPWTYFSAFSCVFHPAMASGWVQICLHKFNGVLHELADVT